MITGFREFCQGLASMHTLCRVVNMPPPMSADNWCKFQAEIITGKNTYNQKISLPKAVKEVITPIFKDLISDSLVERFLHGQTQNSNEGRISIYDKDVQRQCFKQGKLLRYPLHLQFYITMMKAEA